jgi:multiple antibiotic resistance protein
MIGEFLLSFIPLFVAIDVLGNMPCLVALTSGMTPKQRQTVINESVSIACLLIISFILVGKWILRAVGIAIPDFKIAGGLLLLVISASFLLSGKGKFADSNNEKRNIGILPLATPMVTGPTVLIIALILAFDTGIPITLAAIVLNMLIVWLVFLNSQRIFRFIGRTGSCILSRVCDILLAAIAVMLIRQGIMQIFFL